MEFEQIAQLLINIAPSLIALLGIILSVLKSITTIQKEVKNLKTTVETGVNTIKEDVDIKQLRAEVRMVIQENYELKAVIKQLTDTINRIKTQEE